jgi:hypothetical protein
MVILFEMKTIELKYAEDNFQMEFQEIEGLQRILYLGRN